MTSKERANLRSLAAVIKPVAQVGKDGIGENLVQGLSDALEARELIKVTLLPAAGEKGEPIATALAEALKAELVAVIGRKAILYRRSSREEIEHIKF